MKILFLLLLFIPLVSLRLHTDDLLELEELLQPEHKSHIKSSYFDYLLGNNNDDDDDDDIRRFRYPSKNSDEFVDENENEDFLPPMKTHRVDDEPTTTIRAKSSDESSKCIDQYEIKSEQIVRVKYLSDNARLMRMISIEQPSASSQFSLKEICIMKCCSEKDCDLAMLSEQHTRDGYKCYLFACNGTCPLATHQDYSVMIPKKVAQTYIESPRIISTSTTSSMIDRQRTTKSFFRRISILSIILILSLASTIGLMVFLICYCRHHRKRGRRLKNYSVDADYLINGLYL